LTIVGGVFYVIGGAVVGLLLESLSSLGGDLGLGSNGLCPLIPQFPCTNTLPSLSETGGSGLDSLGYLVAGFGVFAGVLIIVGGVLFTSEDPARRKIGGILAIIMILIGGLATLGGLLIGFILAVIGVYLGLTYKSNSQMVIGLGPVGSLHLGPQAAPLSNTLAGSGPLNYCIKCGSQIRPGAVFCGACGARVVE